MWITRLVKLKTPISHTATVAWREQMNTLFRDWGDMGIVKSAQMGMRSSERYCLCKGLASSPLSNRRLNFVCDFDFWVIHLWLFFNCAVVIWKGCIVIEYTVFRMAIQCVGRFQRLLLNLRGSFLREVDWLFESAWVPLTGTFRIHKTAIMLYLA